MDDWNLKNFGKLDAPYKNTEPMVSTKRGTAHKDKFSFETTDKPKDFQNLSKIKISRKHIHKIPKPAHDSQKSLQDQDVHFIQLNAPPILAPVNLMVDLGSMSSPKYQNQQHNSRNE